MIEIRHDLGPFAMVPQYVVESATPSGLKLWCLLWLYTGNGTHEAWPSQPRLASEMGCSRRSVQRTLDELIGLGVVRAEQRSGTSNLYTLTWYPPVTTRATGDAGSAKYGRLGRATGGAGVAPRVAHEEKQSELEKSGSTTGDTTPHVRHAGDAPLTRDEIRRVRESAAERARHERESNP